MPILLDNMFQVLLDIIKYFVQYTNITYIAIATVIQFFVYLATCKLQHKTIYKIISYMYS